ncbi:MAG TPA: IMP dehydrogenase, partial [Flavobacteriales bacterium]|nr:IMP dehydrogenase [Flavobacteriales bacterium]
MENSSVAPARKQGGRPAKEATPLSDRFAVQGLTYDDVLLVPAYSEVLPRAVDIRTRFSRNIALNL